MPLGTMKEVIFESRKGRRWGGDKETDTSFVSEVERQRDSKRVGDGRVILG